MLTKANTNIIEINDAKDYGAVLADISKRHKYLSNDKALNIWVADKLDLKAKYGKMFDSGNIISNSFIKTTKYNEFLENILIETQVTYNRLSTIVEGIDKITNKTSYIISNNMLSINKVLSKIRALSQLHDLNGEYDDIVTNTFTEDDDTNEDSRFASMYDGNGGLRLLNTVAYDDIVKTNDNYDIYIYPVNKNITLSVIDDDLTADKVTNGLALRGMSKRQETISSFKLGKEYNETTHLYDRVTLDYNGAAFAVILDFPNKKLINNISAGLFGSGVPEVLYAFYSETRTTAISNNKWIKLDIANDDTNINGFGYVFDDVYASSIMLIIGQPNYVKKYMDVKQYGTIKENVTISTLHDKISKIDYNTKNTYVVSYLPATIKDKLSEVTTKIIGGIIGFINNLLPDTKKKQTLLIYTYYLNIYDLSVKYNHFQAASKYKSPFYGGDGTTDKITLIDATYQPEGTRINYNIETMFNTKRITSFTDHSEQVHNIKIIERPSDYIEGSDYVFYTDFLIDNTRAYELKLNNVLISNTYISKDEDIDPNIGRYFKVDSSAVNIGINDVLEISYYNSPVDYANRDVLPYTIKMNDIIGNPTYIRQAQETKKNRLLVAKGTYLKSYDIGTEAKNIKLPLKLGIQDITPGIEFSSIKNESGNPDSYVDNSGVVFTTNNGEAVKYDDVIYTDSYIYYGVFGENASGDLGDPHLYYTNEGYVPGSLKAYVYDVSQDIRIPISVNEYQTDTDTTSYDKNIFTIDYNLQQSTIVTINYIPIDSSIGVTNIAKPNKSEIFIGTNSDGAVKLEFAPYTDKYILADAHANINTWTNANNVFVYNRKPSITYEPINVSIRGVKARNRTDYYTGKPPILNEFSQAARNYEYYVSGDALIFNTKIPLQITVKYYFIDDKYRLIGELRRTELKNDTISPILYDYSILIDKRE